MKRLEALIGRAFQFEIGYRPYNPPSTARLDRYVAEVQNEDEDSRRPALVAALQTIRRELGADLHSSRILYSAQILSTLAWRADNNLWNVIDSSRKLIQPEMPVTVREITSEAIKNAAWHSREHSDEAVELALEGHLESSSKMRYNFVKAIGAAARHSKDKLKVNNNVRAFLEKSMDDENPVIARRAKRVFRSIFE